MVEIFSLRFLFVQGQHVGQDLLCEYEDFSPNIVWIIDFVVIMQGVLSLQLCMYHLMLTLSQTCHPCRTTLKSKTKSHSAILSSNLIS